MAVEVATLARTMGERVRVSTFSLTGDALCDVIV